MAQYQLQQIAPGVSWIDHTASTQDLAVNAAAELEHGDVLATDHQTAGRGRLDRSWDTPPGTAAAMSMFFRPELPTEQLGMMTLVVADGLVRWFRELGVTAAVKWPNDILGPDGKKLCGILAQWLPETRAIVIGIGTNLDFTSGPRHASAGALADYGVTLTAQDYVITARQRLLAAVTQFIAEPDATVLEATMATIGQQVRAIMPDGNDVIGTATGLGPNGSLLIQADTVQEIFAADIVHLRPA